jgi:hypothetical protein
LASVVRFALEEVSAVLEDDAELCVVGLAGGELELPGLVDDEHAASSVAAPIAVTASAMRDARGFLPSLKLLMRPRICLKLVCQDLDADGPDTTLASYDFDPPPARLVKELIWVHKIVNITVNMIEYHSGHYRDVKNWHPRMLWLSTVRDARRRDTDNRIIA